MKKTMASCLLILAIVIPAQAVSLNSNSAGTDPVQVSGTLSGRFAFGPVAQDWTYTAEGKVIGILRGLSLTRMSTTHTGNLSDGTISGGTFTMVAFYGDEIQGTYEASVEMLDDSHAHGVAVLSIKGGTGRYAHVKGTLIAIFLETFDDPTWASAKVTWVLDGTIEY